jgi:hypothetical protein
MGKLHIDCLQAEVLASIFEGYINYLYTEAWMAESFSWILTVEKALHTWFTFSFYTFFSTLLFSAWIWLSQ